MGKDVIVALDFDRRKRHWHFRTASQRKSPL